MSSPPGATGPNGRFRAIPRPSFARQVAQPRPFGSGTHAPAVARCFFPLALSRVRRRAVVLIRVSRRDAEEEHPQRRREAAHAAGVIHVIELGLRRRRVGLRPTSSRRKRDLSALSASLRVSARNGIRQFPSRSGDPVAPGWYPVAAAHGPRSTRRARTETCSTASRLAPRACPAEPAPAALSRSGHAACAAPGPGTLGS